MKKEISTWSKFWAPPVVILVAATAFVHVTGVFASADENPISNFHEISPDNRCASGEGAGTRAAGTLFRGASPKEEGLQYLVAHGVKTILNFQTVDEVSSEQDLVKQLGLTSLSDIAHPMDGGMGVNKLPNGDYDNDSIIAAVADMRRSEHFPEYVHCTYGQDRTGMIVALNRVFNECWSPKDAEHEWNQIEGWFHHIFHIPKHRYFHNVMKDASLHKYYQDQLEILVPKNLESAGTAKATQPMPESSLPESEPEIQPAL